MIVEVGAAKSITGPDSPMLTTTREVTIEWGDCDPAGIVFYPRYFAMFDWSLWNHFARVGLVKHEMVRQYGIVGCPMVDTGSRFMVPSKYGDVVRIETTIPEFRRSSFRVLHRLMKGDTLAVEGTETRVWAAKDPDNPDRIKGVPIPEDVIARFR